jgi:hypothetical protein
MEPAVSDTKIKPMPGAPQTASETPVIAPSAMPENVTVAPSELAHRLEDLWPEALDAWLSDHVANSPITRSTEAFNHLVAALPALRQALMEKI